MKGLHEEKRGKLAAAQKSAGKPLSVRTTVGCAFQACFSRKFLGVSSPALRFSQLSRLPPRHAVVLPVWTPPIDAFTFAAKTTLLLRQENCLHTVTVFWGKNRLASAMVAPVPHVSRS